MPRQRRETAIDRVRKSQPARPRRFRFGLYGVAIAVLLAVTIYFLYSFINRMRGSGGRSREGARDRTKVEVLNGCGQDALGSKVRDLLRDAGFDVVNVENADSFDYPWTIVVDRVNDPAAALKIARALGLGKDHVILLRNDELMLSATVILGQDYRKLKLKLD